MMLVVVLHNCNDIKMIALCRALCPDGVSLRGLESLANASLVVVAVPRCLSINSKQSFG